MTLGFALVCNAAQFFFLNTVVWSFYFDRGTNNIRGASEIKCGITFLLTNTQCATVHNILFTLQTDSEDDRVNDFLLIVGYTRTFTCVRVRLCDCGELVTGRLTFN